MQVFWSQSKKRTNLKLTFSPMASFQPNKLSSFLKTNHITVANGELTQWYSSYEFILMVRISVGAENLYCIKELKIQAIIGLTTECNPMCDWE